MSKPTIVFVIVGLIIATMSAGCLGNVSNEMETGNIELENDIIQLNNTITNLTLDNDAKDGSIKELENDILLLELQNQLLTQEVRLQSVEYNITLQTFEDEIEDLEEELAIANSFILENLTSEGGLTTGSSSPSLYESINASGGYMNHA